MMQGPCLIEAKVDFRVDYASGIAYYCNLGTSSRVACCCCQRYCCPACHGRRGALVAWSVGFIIGTLVSIVLRRCR